MTGNLNRIARAGYTAARGGALPAANPWPDGTLGAFTWAHGWLIGDLPPGVRALFAWVLL